MGTSRERQFLNKVFVILGPTSSGKTSLALDLCKKFNGEIISADSRQAIKFMDVGTGKVPVNSSSSVKKEKNHWVFDEINIWGYDLATPNQFFSGYDFSLFSLKKAREISNLGKTIFLVGGTGFYIDLFTGDIRPSKVKPDLEFRLSLEKMSLPELQQKLLVLNKDIYLKIDQKNKVRLIRAIEKLLVKDVNENTLPYLKNFEFVYIGLDAPRNALYKKADVWVEEIWRNGLVEEIQNLRSLGYEDSPKIKGLVYRTGLKYLGNEIGEKDAIERIKFDIHSYIRRQQTWFKRKKDIIWVDITQDDFREIIYNIVKEKMKNG